MMNVILIIKSGFQIQCKKYFLGYNNFLLLYLLPFILWHVNFLVTTGGFQLNLGVGLQGIFNKQVAQISLKQCNSQLNQ